MNTDKRIELTQVAQIADQIDYLEALFVDLDGAPESQRVTMAKLRTLGMLAAAYNKAGFCRAAAECLRLSEPYFCQLIAHTEEPLNENIVDSLIWNYLALGAYVEARRAARLTADIVGYKLSATSLARIELARKKRSKTPDKAPEDQTPAELAAEAARLEAVRVAETARITRWYNDQFQALISTHEKSANNLALRVRRMKGLKAEECSDVKTVTPLPVVPQAVSA